MRQDTPPPAPASDVQKDKLDKLTEVMHDMRRENLELKIDNDSQEQYERRGWHGDLEPEAWKLDQTEIWEHCQKPLENILISVFAICNHWWYIILLYV